ncbi:hypothetical protein ACROYT_G022714 [Oculina patagonica]
MTVQPSVAGRLRRNHHELHLLRQKNQGTQLPEGLRTIRIICNYEIKIGGYVFFEDLKNEAENEKENLFRDGDRITMNMLSRVVYEIFGVTVSKSRKRACEGNSQLKSIFRNLVRKTRPSERAEKDSSFQQEWEMLRVNTSEVLNGVEWQWRSMLSQNSVSFIHVNESLRYDGRRPVFEVIFSKNSSEDMLLTDMLFDQRHVPQEAVNKVGDFCSEMNIIDKAKQFLIMFEKSTLCHGVPSSVDGIDLHNVDTVRHCYTENESSVSEERIFSTGCEVLTKRSAYKICARCHRVKMSIVQKQKRKQDTINEAKPSAFCNHRYMSKDQLIEKIAVEKKRAEEEKKKGKSWRKNF